MGNDSLQDQIKQKGNTRDQLLSFIIQHLKNIQAVQRIEVDEMKNKEKWFRELARGQKGFHLPQATRWHEAAKLFKRSAQAMCRGDLSKGKALLEQALEQEKIAYDDMPKMVSDRLNEVERSGGNAPIELTREGAEVCPATRLPQEISIADKILNIRDTMEEAAPLKRTKPYNYWWEQDELDDDDQNNNQTEEEEELEEEQLQEADIEKEKSDIGKEE